MKVWVLSTYENGSYDSPELKAVTSDAQQMERWKAFPDGRSCEGHSHFVEEFELDRRASCSHGDSK